MLENVSTSMKRLIISLLLSSWVSPAIADDTGKANKLFVEAVQLLQSADSRHRGTVPRSADPLPHRTDPVDDRTDRRRRPSRPGGGARLIPERTESPLQGKTLASLRRPEGRRDGCRARERRGWLPAIRPARAEAPLPRRRRVRRCSESATARSRPRGPPRRAAVASGPSGRRCQSKTRARNSRSSPRRFP